MGAFGLNPRYGINVTVRAHGHFVDSRGLGWRNAGKKSGNIGLAMN